MFHIGFRLKQGNLDSHLAFVFLPLVPRKDDIVSLACGDMACQTYRVESIHYMVDYDNSQIPGTASVKCVSNSENEMAFTVYVVTE